MKLSKRTSSHFILFIVLGLVIGSLCWELIERLISLSGRTFSLALDPVGFDAGVLQVWLKINPGSFLGAVFGFLLFRRF